MVRPQPGDDALLGASGSRSREASSWLGDASLWADDVESEAGRPFEGPAHGADFMPQVIANMR